MDVAPSARPSAFISVGVGMDRIGAAGPKSVAVVLGLRAGGVVLDLPAGAGNSAVLVRQVVQCSAIDPWMQRAVNGAPWPTTIRPIRPLRRIGDQAMPVPGSLPLRAHAR